MTKKLLKYYINLLLICLELVDKFYKPILEKKIFKDFFFIKKKNIKILFKVIKVKHGNIYANAFRFNDIAYVSDCSYLSKVNIKQLKEFKGFNY